MLIKCYEEEELVEEGGGGPWDVEDNVGGGERGGEPAEDVGEAGKHQQSEWSEPLLEEPADDADQWGENVVQAHWNWNKTVSFQF